MNGQWKFYDPATRDVPPGMLRWQEEGVQALVTDPKSGAFVMTPMTPAETSKSARIATFTLDSDGTLEGDVREILAGHPALNLRARFASSTPGEREQELIKELKARLPAAEITNVKCNLPEDVGRGAGLTYHVRVPGYAQRTGKRLFLTPAFFELGLQSRFPESKREYPIYFHYPWSEFDSVRIKLPDNYELDHPDAPGGMKFGATGQYLVHMAITKEREPIFERQFVFCANDMLLFEQGDYPLLKQLFDRVHECDAHVVTLKSQPQQSAGAAN